MLAFICAAMVAVESFLYSLLQSMGLIGGSYADINNAFPDNTLEENQVLYSIANDPLQNAGGFTPPEWASDIDIYHFPAPGSRWNPGSDMARANWEAIMSLLGFAVVQNNIDVAVDAGFDPEFVGTKSAVVNIGGILGGVYIWGYTGSGSVWGSSEPYGEQGNAGNWWDYPVLKLEWNGVTRYCTAMKLAAAPEYGVNGGYEGSFQYPPFELWTSDNKLYIRNSRYIPGQITVDTFRAAGFDIPYDDMISEGAVNVGEDMLSFGDTDNPVVGVTYDPATGVTSYKYKDGTISTTPPATLSDTVTLSPSITQPLTNYIINEGDITNIYNPDAAIPSDSSVPFDFTALGDTIISVFKPAVNFNPEPMFNRFKNKFDPQAYWEKMVKKWNVQPHRPSYPVTINWLGKSVTFDFWDWCDVLLNQQNYMLYRFFVRFFIYCGYVLLIGQLILGLFNIKLTPHVEDSTILGFRG